MDGGYQKFFKEARKNSGLADQPTVRARAFAKATKASKVETPEDRIRAELASRMKKKRAARKKKRAQFPVGPAIIALLTLVGGGYAYFNGDALESLFARTFGRVEIGIFGDARAAGEEKPAEKTPEKSAEKNAPAKPDTKQTETGAAGRLADVPNTKQWTPDELSFFSHLNERKQQLDLREAELNRLEDELQKRKLELDEKLKQLEAMRTDISKTLKTRVASDQEKVEKLVQVYSSMKPQQASKVIESLDEDLAVEVLDKMKKKSAAEVLNMMDSKKARRLSELLTGYERSPSSEDEPEAAQAEKPSESAPSRSEAPPETKSEKRK